MCWCIQCSGLFLMWDTLVCHNLTICTVAQWKLDASNWGEFFTTPALECGKTKYRLSDDQFVGLLVLGFGWEVLSFPWYFASQPSALNNPISRVSTEMQQKLSVTQVQNQDMEILIVFFIWESCPGGCFLWCVVEFLRIYTFRDLNGGTKTSTGFQGHCVPFLAIPFIIR